MLKEWQFNVLFWVGVGGAITLLIGPWIGLETSPTAVTGIGAILTYVLTQKKAIVKHDKPGETPDKETENDGRS